MHQHSNFNGLDLSKIKHIIAIKFVGIINNERAAILNFLIGGLLDSDGISREPEEKAEIPPGIGGRKRFST
jgi:hypothetical protein